MSALNNSLLLGQGGAAAAYNIERSLRFNSADSPRLSRTPASAGDRKTWTWSGWVKLCSTDVYKHLFTIENGVICRFGNNAPTHLIHFSSYNGSDFDWILETSSLYRDVSAWMHVMFVLDTTQATASNRLKLYTNGQQVTAFSTAVYPNQNTNWSVNNTVAHEIGSYAASFFGNFYLSDVHFIDGQALTPSSFGETSATTGQWVPKAYSGTYGTNGYKLTFSDNSGTTSTTLGKDTSGNNNNWTPSGFDVAAGAGNDSLVDTPTSYGTGNSGGDVRGNYCTLNPANITSNVTLSNGNLDVSQTASAAAGAYGTIGVTSGKWYWEVRCTSGNNSMVGIADLGKEINSRQYNDAAGGGLYYYQSNGAKYGYLGGSFASTAYGASFTTSDIIGIALDMDNGNVNFYKNGVDQGVANTSSLLGKTITAAIGNGGANATNVFNFGQRAFAYTAPSGFKALCDTNLTAPTIAKPNTVMDTVLYSANGSTQTISGLNFSPDLVWSKSRNRAYPHGLHDSVRGAYKYIRSSGTNAETDTSGDSATYTLTSFNSDGFSVGADGGAGVINNNAAGATTYAAWCWDAGSSNVSNTSGTITSTVRASTANGCSIVTYTGTGANATVGHGCGTAPSLILCKQLNTAQNWNVYHSSMNAGNYLRLNTADAAISSTTVWNSTAPTSTVFSVGTASTTNGSGGSYVAYCWTPVAGLSSSFSYTGNGAADGPYIHLGFRPAFLLIKQTTSASTTNWVILDSKRLGYNVDNDPQYPNLAAIDGTTDLVDLTANGFKIRSTDTSVNASAGTYVGYAWAESPFQYARAR